MIQKSLESVTAADVEALRLNKVPEGRTLDYKASLPGGKDDDKKEFLADVSSFANAIGGDLIFGIPESNGVPDAVKGISTANLDAEKLRLEEIIRSGIEPRIVGIRIHGVEGFPNGPVAIVRVPRSFASPHMVTFKNTSRFYTRNSSGKYQMDVGELRAAFDVSGALSERLQRFRTDRLSKIAAGDMPVTMHDAPKLVLHVLPFSAFTLGTYIDARIQAAIGTELVPIGAGGWNHRHNFDGFVTFTMKRMGDTGSYSYAQFFRNGAVEAVSADLLSVSQWEGKKFFSGVAYEEHVLQALRSYLKLLRQLGVSTPLLITMTMLGVRGVYLGGGAYSSRDQVPIDRDTLLLPDVVIEDYDADASQVMRPIFDAVWNAAGFERSFNYNQDGVWSPPR